MPPVKNALVKQVTTAGKPADKPDLLAVEEPLEIRLGFGPVSERQQRSLSVTLRTPGHDFELALGFLFTEGIINSMDDVGQVAYCRDVGRQQQDNIVRVELQPHIAPDWQKLQRNFYTTSSCGVCGKSSIEAVQQRCNVLADTFTLPAGMIYSLPEVMRTSQPVFTHTGGLHASALFSTKGELKILREDVGRHNALDKVIGAMFMQNRLPLSDYLLLVSGRAGFELVQKAVMAGLAVMVAVGAPSSLAVELAQQCNLTLIGFARDNKFNIYAGAHRIILS
ncbi:MAG: formate dehydrogenase accessory sulfurtransferase FdhD [Cyclobacteriaceae bacterium]|nr:formate dehydrogenase accessory sulfurtransferase FdhD [Cyclobacteriaceae bacterium]MCX7636897.1 formate dehydrogenase accessory sulfurtransferase FdhD [Cyclobacteriaceae bacterium]MDW8330217.1 formate dehydrogenase accessory sulfurtransferase FdhD [Cyclobacteriaceae bacterium]